MAIPSRVRSLAEGRATVECFGVEREVSLLLLADPVSVGDYLLVRAGGYAYDRIEPAAAEQLLRIMAEVVQQDAPASPAV